MPARQIGRKVKARAPRERRPAGRWGAGALAAPYDPEAEQTKRFLVPTEHYVKRFQLQESWDTGPDGKKLASPQRAEFDGVLLEPVMQGRSIARLKPVHVGSFAELRQFLTSEAGRSKRVLESVGDYSFDTDMVVAGGSGGAMSDPMRMISDPVPLMNGPFYKQLYWYDYLRMHSECFEAVNKSPLAASAIKIMTRFVVGRGISYHIKEPRCEAVWTEFWERNNMREKLRACARDLPWAGEILIRYYERVPGYLSCRIVDPSTCQEIVTDPEDLEHVYFYHFMWPSQYQMFTAGQIPISKFVVQQVPPTNVQHVKINVASQEKRGRSDLLPALPWIKRFNDYYNGVTVKALLEANLVWKLKIQGDDADVARIMAEVGQLPFPPPGGMWGENEAMTLEPMSAQLTASRGSSGIGQQIASIVATSMNLPAEYFNIEGTGPARATALVRTDPAVKTIEDRQQLLTEMLEEMYDRVISSAILAGRLPREMARFEPEVRAGDHTGAMLPPAEPPAPGMDPAQARPAVPGPGVGAPPGVHGPGGALMRPGGVQGPSRTSWSPGVGPGTGSGPSRRFEPVPLGRG